MFLNRPNPMKRTLRNILTLVLFNLVATPMFAADDSVSTVIVFSSLAFVIVLLIFLALIMGDQSIRISRSTLAKEEQDLPPSFIPSKKEIFGINDDPIAGDAKIHVLQRGHEIKLDGRADATLQHPEIKLVSVRPTDYVGMQPIPKMLVSEGDSVKIGQKLSMIESEIASISLHRWLERLKRFAVVRKEPLLMLLSRFLKQRLRGLW